MRFEPNGQELVIPRDAYVETSVWGMLVPGQNRSMRQASMRFFQACADGYFSPHVSSIVIDEIDDAPPKVRNVVYSRMSKLHPKKLEMDARAEELAQRFLDAGVVPRRREDDAGHVACAIVNQIPLLVSWNYRHLANVRKAEGFNAVAVLAGYNSRIEIHTPFEVIGWKRP